MTFQQFEDFCKVTMIGAWWSTFPLDIEANLIGIPNWNNSSYQIILGLITGLLLAIALKDEEVFVGR